MSFRKNNLSFGIWIIYLTIVGALFAFSAIALVNEFHFPILAVLGCGIGLLLILALIYYLSEKMDFKEELVWNKTSVFKAEALILALISIMAIGTRVYIIKNIPASGECLQMARQITNSNIHQIIEKNTLPEHKGTAVYVLVLSFLLKVFGNQVAWVVGLQMILQLMGMFILYAALRKMCGRMTAGLFLALMSLLPYSVREVVHLSPNIFCFFLLSCGVYLDVLYLEQSGKRSNRKNKALLACILGVFSGILLCLDLTALCLVIIASGCLNIGNYREENLVNRKPFGLLLACVAVGYFITAVIMALGMQDSVGNILNTSFSGVREGNFAFLIQQREMSLCFLFALVILGVLSFMKRKEEDIFSVWILCFSYIAILIGRGSFSTSMNGIYFVFVFMAILAAISVSELFYNPNLVIEEIKDEMKEELPLSHKMSQLPGIEKKEKMVSTDQADTSEKTVERRYIKNPLPLPQKHVRKAMEYPLEVSEDMMKFDIEVKDDDDYDLLT